MIPKVSKGRRVGGLLRYLYGPGAHEEHQNPHLVAAWDDPAELEPPTRADGAADVRRLAGLLTQPVDAVGPSAPARPVWQCSISLAPEDRTGGRVFTDSEFAYVAGEIVARMGFAGRDDPAGCRWVAVRHDGEGAVGSGQHIHLAVTRVRQDGAVVGDSNDWNWVQQVCRELEEELGLRVLAQPGASTEARAATREEQAKTARHEWQTEPRRELAQRVRQAAAGAGSDTDFMERMRDRGVMVYERHSQINPGQITGYAVALPGDRNAENEPVKYSGARLAPDLSLPKVRTRWAGGGDGASQTQPHGETEREGLAHPAGLGPRERNERARAILTSEAHDAARNAAGEDAYVTQLRDRGLRVELVHREDNPDRVAGYKLAVPGDTDSKGHPVAYHAATLDPDLALSRLREQWAPAEERRSRSMRAPGMSGEERAAVLDHAAKTAQQATQHLASIGTSDPQAAAGIARDAAAALYGAAHTIENPRRGGPLHQAAAEFDRSAREPGGQTPAPRGGDGGPSGLHTAARALMLAGHAAGRREGQAVVTLVYQLASLADAVGDLRRSQQRTVQAQAAARTATDLRTTITAPTREETQQPAAARPSRTPGPRHPQAPQPGEDPPQPGRRPPQPPPGPRGPSPGRGPRP